MFTRYTKRLTNIFTLAITSRMHSASAAQSPMGSLKTGGYDTYTVYTARDCKTMPHSRFVARRLTQLSKVVGRRKPFLNPDTTPTFQLGIDPASRISRSSIPSFGWREFVAEGRCKKNKVEVWPAVHRSEIVFVAQ